ncbi:hypothetical protein WOLCODRAFT_159800 [Wolfiporia cocos MD-104 SS10]|uniref:UvrD-like helicase ATP-binding domain-containing protein n=1 Tax=Wolfiporia cocos (strain MD-104) TaxID=742152 RepID=A0A2H3J2T1_WOLCO|nr:hypothetical protein WOLCODRAFT_159800 [Wolfiporia cocos MD-104 SS10]
MQGSPSTLKVPEQSFDKVLLDISLLSNEVALGNAISVLESRLESSATSAETFVTDLGRIPALFAFAVCGETGDRKQAYRRQLGIDDVLDPKPFRMIDAPVPKTQEEACQLSFAIIEQQKYTLQQYLRILRDSQLKQIFKKAYLDEVLKRDSEHDASESGAVAFPSTADPATYDTIHSMRATLYFESAKGFGNRRILMSTRADSDVRHARKHEWPLFTTIYKSIRDLSKGRFTCENHKQVTNPEANPQIYQAQVGDRHLVYYFDSVIEYESKTTKEAIKVFGVYEDNEMREAFWNAVSSKIDGIYSQEHVGLPNLHKDDLFKLHEMLVLDKYVTFSQAFLNSILADQDVAHVFNVSEKEQEIIEYPLSCYVIGRSGTGKTTTMMFKMLGIERAWKMCDGAMAKPRQVFVTQSGVLARKVQEYFNKLSESLDIADKSSQELRSMVDERRGQPSQRLVDEDEEALWQDDVDERFSKLQDEDFPLFVTFDKLCRLLENDVSRDDSSAGNWFRRHRTQLVSFEKFQESYWPHLPQPLTKGLDPAVVFGEFMGVIKGSEDTLHNTSGYLDEKTYISLSYRTQPTFADQRDTIYQLFKAYLKKKKERGEHDVADRTHAILKDLRNPEKGVPGQPIDFLYIDEAQDNRLIDVLVLRMICANATSGLFIAGDTAQTISYGSAFRFNDLKAFLYRIEENGSSTLPRVNPRTFRLMTNYRSHAGIIDCARTVVDLIKEFWPYSIDDLPPEKGKIGGIKPIFFSRWNVDSGSYEDLLFGSSGDPIDFGADQCVLVRDNSTRKKLLRALVDRDIGLIMTVYEAKGLEFNDVLLYDFFADSTADPQSWRIFLREVSPQSQESNGRSQVIDARHNVLCRELKLLYVAITRARKNLWIADTSDVGNPMRLVWEARDQIETLTPGTDAPRLAKSSTKEEWAKKGDEMFKNKRYIQAIYCYGRASRQMEKDIARAYHLRELARSTPVHSRDGGKSRIAAYTRAAQAFRASANCPNVAGEDRITYHRIAAECYSQCGEYRSAGKAYYNAGLYGHSVQSYRKGGFFDEAVYVIKAHRLSIEQDIAKGILEVARLEYLRTNQLNKALELFSNEDEAMEYMDDFGLDEARIALLKKRGRFAEVAELQLSKGQILEAAESFMMDGSDSASLRRASRCLLDGLWHGLSLGTFGVLGPATQNIEPQKLLLRIEQLRLDLHDERTQTEVRMFRAIMRNDIPALLQFGTAFYSKDGASALMCLDRVFCDPPCLHGIPPSQVISNLHYFHLYVQLMQKLTAQAHPCQNERTRRIFAIKALSADRFLLYKGTILYVRSVKHRVPNERTDEGAVVLEGELEKLLKHELRDRLRHRVQRENETCKNIQALDICLAKAVTGHCAQGDSCTQDHIDADSYQSDAYNIRIRVILQQMLIYNTVYAIEQREEQNVQRRHWLQILHKTLYPPHYKLGSSHNIETESIPEYEAAKPVVMSWIFEWLNTLHLAVNSSYRAFLTSFIRIATLAFTFDKQSAELQLTRAPCVTTHKYSILLRRWNDRKVYALEDFLAFMINDHETSILRGVLFVRHIIKRRIPIDIVVLCDLLDLLCASIVLRDRYQTTRSFHNVTLPQSWLVRLVDFIKRLCIRTTRFKELRDMYLEPISQLMSQIQTGKDAEYLLFHDNDILSQASQDAGLMRAMSVSRLCKNLCLLGHNSLDSYQDAVFRIINTLHGTEHQVDGLYEQYASATSWHELEERVRLFSTAGSPLDEMVQLVEVDKLTGDTHSFPNVKQITYKTIDELPGLLRTGTTSILRSNPGSREASLVLSVPAPVNTDEAHQSENDAEEDPHQNDGVPDILTEQILQAARKILVTYRRHAKRRDRLEKPGNALRSAGRRRVAASFQKASQSMTWPRRQYRMLFLGPLPHLVVYLEGVKDYLNRRKTAAKKLLRTAQHEELDTAGMVLTDISRWIKEAIRLHKRLLPESELHRKQDLEELKACVRDVQQLAEQLPSGAAAAWRGDLELALKGILRPRVTVRTKERPVLNVEDIDPLEVS